MKDKYINIQGKFIIIVISNCLDNNNFINSIYNNN